ncbi:MAG TPA: cytochrome c/FTR1 family iron permease [bacterium]|nr:cytochrome c/FTR1 family iron permease [bacterium]
MKKLAGTLALLFLLGAFLIPSLTRHPAQAEESPEKSPRFLVHLMDYLAVDYGGAVKNGKVISLSEYKEQTDFSKTALDLARSLPELKASTEIPLLVEHVDRLIRAKADPQTVAAAARQAQAKVIQWVDLPVAPAQWPNLTTGRMLFQNNCAKCHGTEGRGDGPSAKGLETKPANFQDLTKMRELSPFQVFNTARLGVPNTPMAGFPNFSDEDTWNLAFYIISLRYQDNPEDTAALFQELKARSKLKDGDLLKSVASSSDEALAQRFSLSADQGGKTLAALRLHSNQNSPAASLDLASSLLDAAFRDYQAFHFDSAAKKAVRSYLEGIEPIESRLRADDPRAVGDLEEAMGLVRSGMNSQKPPKEVALAVTKAQDLIQQARKTLGQQGSSPGLTFLLAFGILIREGFEAALLIVALLGVIRVSGAQKAARWVHGGWLAAVGLGILAWFFSGWLMGLSGMGRELMEGVTGVVTVLILLYLGFWLHSRTEITRWKQFIEVQVKAAVEERNLIQLAFISFLAAFREAIETVLFLRAIWLEGGMDTKTALGAGVVAAFAAVLVLGWVLVHFSTRIPIKTLFNISSIIMVLLAVILTGKAAHSFQEVDLLSVTLSPLALHSDWLGLYPTRETLLAQWVVLALSVFLWIRGKKPPQKA